MTAVERQGLQTDRGRGHTIRRVGTATRIITPDRSMRTAGYGARTDRSDGVMQDLHAKAVVLEDENGNRAVVGVAELLGVMRDLRSAVVEECGDRYALAPDELLLNASHTHTGPEYGEDPWGAWGFDEEDDRLRRHRTTWTGSWEQRSRSLNVSVAGTTADRRR